MARFTLGIVGRGVNEHSRCFEDFGESLTAALRDLGHEICDFGDPGRLIVFGANNTTGDVPKDAIIFNTEQVGSATGVAEQMQSFKMYRERGNVVWDYSQTNIAALRAAGLKRVVHCPIGYHPSMRKLKPVDQDIDVLFYGSLNERRTKVLKHLNDTRLKVVHLFGVYGETRDAAIARSKVVLNVHYYQQPIFEIFRVSHLLANRVCVVSEDGGCDPELEEFAERATTLVPYQQLVETCQFLLRKGEWGEESRDIRAARGYIEFAGTDLVNNVRKALEQS